MPLENTCKFHDEIIRLISTKREGEYWDFKRETHTNNAELLHDILALANVLHDGPRYLIFGINDPSQGCEIIGLNTDLNRKTQVQYIDFVRGKHFAGGINPVVELRTITIEEKLIEILVIFDLPMKPYYLARDFKDQNKLLKANSIYTRRGDTNTPIDKSADLHEIEKMWRQRFGFDLPVLERMQLLLMEPENWFKDIGNETVAYHKHFPEYRIEFERPEPFTEIYSFFYLNFRSFWGGASLYYHSTQLVELEYVYLDEMRIIVGCPQTNFVDKLEQWYYYYDLSTIDGKFHYFPTNGDAEQIGRGSRQVTFLFFRSEREKVRFDAYLVSNWDTKLDEEERINDIASLVEKDMESHGFQSTIDVKFVHRVRRFFEIWRLKEQL